MTCAATTDRSDNSPKSQSLAEAAKANVETGVLLLCKEALVTAIQDRRLDRGHLRVLASLVGFLNRQTAKAWPDRRTIADEVGVEPVTVSNKLGELRRWGYLIAERERVAEANNRSLMVYTFGNIDHETIRREIQAYVDRIKASGNQKVTEDSGSAKSPSTVTVTEGDDLGAANITEAAGPKSPWAVDSNSEKEPVSEVAAIGIAERPKPKRRKSQIDADWRPSAEQIAWVKEGWAATDQQIAAQAELFRDYHVAKGSLMADWGAAWRTWWRTDYHKIPRRGTTGGPSAGAKSSTTGEAEQDRKDLINMGSERHAQYKAMMEARDD
jgi:hypothetical protein